MVTSPSDAAIDRVAFYLFRKEAHHLDEAKARETWTWLPSASKRQWREPAREIAVLVLEEP